MIEDDLKDLLGKLDRIVEKENQPVENIFNDKIWGELIGRVKIDQEALKEAIRLGRISPVYFLQISPKDPGMGHTETFNPCTQND